MSAIGGVEMPRASLEEAKQRLEAILSDKVMRFNPFRVGDAELLACAERARWRPFPALTQMVIFHFSNIRTVVTHHEFEAIFFRVGNSKSEQYFPLGDFIHTIAHHTHKMQIRTQIDGKNITRSNIANLQNRSFFVSHAVVGTRYLQQYMFAYRMHRLRGDTAEQANTIRNQMCRAKIAMLEELMTYPASLIYLGYNGSDLDYTTPIRTALATFAQYPYI